MQLPPPFEAVVPDIHSSDYRTALSDPFLYLLTRRLGITKALSSGTALTRGSWFHTIAELDTLTGEAPGHPDPLTPSHPAWLAFLTKVESRIEELTDTCAKQGIVGDARRTILATEREDALTALAWYCSASTVEITPKLGTFRQFLAKPFWRILGREIPISDPMVYGGNRRRTTLDMLLLDLNTNNLWVLDYKSCSEPTTVRLASCPIEFQTLHSISLLQGSLRSGTLYRVFPDLPPPTELKVGGMMHLAIQKPSLRFGQQDRNFTLDTSPFKSGPRKGQPRNEKNYFGEPDPANFRLRCDDWYHGRGEYSHLQAERDASPVVNISYTYAEKLDADAWQQYTRRCLHVQSLATRLVEDGWLKGEEIAPFNTLSPFAPFYLLPPSQWLEVLQNEGLIVQHRHTQLRDHPHALHA